MREEKITEDQSAWADFMLSKSALMIASVIILCAAYQIAADLGNMNSEQEINALALDMRAAIDEAGSINLEESKPITYSFDPKMTGLAGNALKSYISGEYVKVATMHNGREIYSVKPLTFRNIPFDEKTLRYHLKNEFGRSGTKDEPLTEINGSVMKFISKKAAPEKQLNTSMIVYIQKVPIYIQNDPVVSKLEYTLVYQ